MRCFRSVCIVAMFCITHINIQGITLVYNLRIGETTRAVNPSFGTMKPSVIALTPFAQFRHFKNDFKQSAGGMLGTYIFMHKDFFARINAAGGRVHAELDNTLDYGATEADDLLFTGGYSWRLGDYTRVGIAGHLGFPLHTDHILQSVELGTGHIGLGVQCDASHAFSDTQMILLAGRFIHFFPRNITVTLNDVMQNVNFHLGNVLDVLFSYQQSWREHMIYFGYNPTFTLGTDPPPGTIPYVKFTTITNSFFFTYRYGFMIKDLLSAIILGFSYGLTKVPAPFYSGHIINSWFTWGIDF